MNFLMNDNYPNRVKFLKIRFYKKILSLLKNKFYRDKIYFYQYYF